MSSLASGETDHARFSQTGSVKCEMAVQLYSNPSHLLVALTLLYVQGIQCVVRYRLEVKVFEIDCDFRLRGLL